jgi:hypothetical protein
MTVFYLFSCYQLVGVLLPISRSERHGSGHAVCGNSYSDSVLMMFSQVVFSNDPEREHQSRIICDPV